MPSQSLTKINWTQVKIFLLKISYLAFLSIRATFATLIVILLGIIVNLIQVPLLLTSLYDRALYYHINSLIAYIIWESLQLIYEKLSGATVKFTPETLKWLQQESMATSKYCQWSCYLKNYFNNQDSHASAIVISNHCAASDWYMIHAVANRLGCLGYLRYVMKDSIKYIPIFGFGMKMMNMVFLKRNWFADMSTIRKTFEVFAEKDSRCLPVWVVSFPEGSRITPEKRLESQTFCKENHKKVLNHVLYPRIKGFVATVQGIRQSTNIKYVYDFTLAFYDSLKGFGAAPSLFDINILGNAQTNRVMIDVKRFLLVDLPESDEDLSLWLQNLFYEKDLFLEALKTKWESEANPMGTLKED